MVVELCSLTFRLDDLSKANVVAAALFGDGAAACVLRCGEGGLAAVEAAGEHLWPDTLDIMGWEVKPDSLGVIFAKSVPSFLAAHIASAIDRILGRHGLAAGNIDRFVCHPGGAKVVTALEQALALHQGTLDHERSVLADYGNMSASTVLFVLERVIAAGLPPRAALTAVGPGFTASCAVLAGGP